MKIAILTVVSAEDVSQWELLIQTVRTHFMGNAERHFFVFSDAESTSCSRPDVSWVTLSKREFSEIHLRRHQWCLSIQHRLLDFDYAYFVPVFARFQRQIDDDFFPETTQQLVAVQHPRFVNIPVNRLPYERDQRSQAFVRIGQGKQYITSEIYGGTVDAFIRLSKIIDSAIATDAAGGIAACRLLESHLNRYIIDNPVKIHHAGYSYPEGWDLGVPQMIQMAAGGACEGQVVWRGYRQRPLATGASVELSGDLGMQLTQYAAGRNLSSKTGVRLVVDTSTVVQGDNRSYHLGEFNIDAEVIHHRRLSSRLGSTIAAWYDRISSGQRINKIELEKGFVQKNGANKLNHSNFSQRQHPLEGIENIRDELMEELKCERSLSKSAHAFLERIESAPTVAVHVPRKKGGSCGWPTGDVEPLPTAYYQKAINHLIERMPESAVFIFFTDDIDWAKSQLICRASREFIALSAPARQHEDFILMRACQAKIISRAPISWWAAWLSKNQDQHQRCVVAPSVQPDLRLAFSGSLIVNKWTWIDCSNLHNNGLHNVVSESMVPEIIVPESIIPESIVDRQAA
jgi:hypothetical protein